MSKRLDKVDTQEIKLPKSNSDYGDNFNGEEFCTKNTRKNDKKNTSYKIPFYEKITKNQLAIISSCILVVIIVIGIVVVSLSSQKVEKKDETTTSSSISTIKEEKKYTNPITNEHYNKDTQTKYTYIEEENTTQAPSTEIVTTIQPTTQVAETSKQIETAVSPTVSFETETEAATCMEKILSVDDISVIKTDDNLFICTANGTFDGYSDEELLNLVSISSTSGAPIISSPSLNGSTFSFYIGLSDECDGELCIHFGNYDYYQPISSMS